MVWLFALLWLAGCQSAEPETAEEGLRQQLAEQTQVLREMKNELASIRQEMQESGKRLAREAPPNRGGGSVRQVSIDDDFVRGNPKAPLTLIEFSDFECPFCVRFYRDTLPQIEKEYIQTGKLKFVYRDFPLQAIHKNAFKAAEAANCAGEQGKFWDMHDLLFENYKNLGPKHLKKYAKQLGLSTEEFNHCLDSEKYADEVNKDFLDGQQAGVGGTPGFFLGRTTSDGTIEGFQIKGARPFSYFKQIIGAMLQEAKPGA